MPRPSTALIDLDALRHNYRLARQRHGGRALAVLKADAYGHGAARCAQALADIADGYAVAVVEEALALRAAGIVRPILVLEGAFDTQDLRQVREHALWTVVHHEEQLRMVELQPGAPLNVWLKLDSGMGRLGLPPAQARAIRQRLQASGRVGALTWMSHFARADEPQQPTTAAQTERFDAALDGLPEPRSLCNSAGILHHPGSHRDWARPGLMLYGIAPTDGDNLGLKPVMTLRSQVFAIRELAAGQPLGYGALHVAPRASRIGLVALGYADGVPRNAPQGTPLRVGDGLAPLVGRISMDMMTVDLTDLPEAGIGSPVELWGPEHDIRPLASACGTIPYELLCGVKRVPVRWSGGQG